MTPRSGLRPRRTPLTAARVRRDPQQPHQHLPLVLRSRRQRALERRASPTETWENDWLFMVSRYTTNKRVVGADLYNEVRRDLLDDPELGPRRRARLVRRPSQHLGDRILTEANPNLLIIVEGINWTGLPVDGLPHGRPTSPRRAASRTRWSRPTSSSTRRTSTTTPARGTAARPGSVRPTIRGTATCRPQELISELNRQAFFVTGEERRISPPRCGSASSAIGGREETGAVAARVVRALRRLTDPHRRRLRVLAAGRLARPDGTDNGWALLAWDAAGQRIGSVRRRRLARLRLDAADRSAPATPGRCRPSAVEDAQPATTATSSTSLRDARRGRLGQRRPQGRVPRRAPAGRPQPHRQPRPLPRGRTSPGHRRLLRGRPRRDAMSPPTGPRGYTKFQCAPELLPDRLQRARCRASPSALCAGTSQSLSSAGRTVWFDRGDNRPAAPRRRLRNRQLQRPMRRRRIHRRHRLHNPRRLHRYPRRPLLPQTRGMIVVQLRQDRALAELVHR